MRFLWFWLSHGDTYRDPDLSLPTVVYFKFPVFRKKINVWVMLLSIFIYSIGAVFLTLRPSSCCEWVFHLAVLWVYSLQGIYMKIVVLLKSFSVSVNMNWAFICGYAYVNLCRCFAMPILTALKKPNPLNSHMYLFFFLCVYFFSASQCFCIPYWCNYFKLGLWFCGACYLLVLVTLRGEKYVVCELVSSVLDSCCQALSHKAHSYPLFLSVYLQIFC